jgi:hypothetical protein
VAARSRDVLKDPFRRLPEMPITFVIPKDDNVSDVSPITSLELRCTIRAAP